MDWFWLDVLLVGWLLYYFGLLMYYLRYLYDELVVLVFGVGLLALYFRRSCLSGYSCWLGLC